ncbi:hypothetical protein EON81_25645, partial [bacterium]
MTFPTLALDDWPAQAAELREQFQSEMFGPVGEPIPLYEVEASLGEENPSGRIVQRILSAPGLGPIDVLHATPNGP